MMLGTLGYPVYVGSLWYCESDTVQKRIQLIRPVTNSTHEWFPITAGAFLGLAANLLWTAAGYIAFSYPTEQERGSFISMQWALLSVGSKCFVLAVYSVKCSHPHLTSPQVLLDL